MKSLFSKLYIRQFLLVMIAIFSLIPVITGACITYWYTKSTVAQECIDYANAIFEEISDSISLVTSRINSTAQTIQSYPEIYTISKQEISYEEKYKELSIIFEKIMPKDSAVASMDFIANDGSIYHFGESNISANLNDEYLNKLSRQQLLFGNSPVFFEDRCYYQFGKTVYNYITSTEYGKIVLYIDTSVFYESIEDADIAQGTFFISVDDRIINHPDKNMVGSKLYIPDEVLSDISDDEKYNYTMIDYVLKNKSVANCVKITGIIQNKWLFKAMNRIITATMVILIFMILFAVLIAILSSKQLAKNISNLTKRMRRLDFNNISHTEHEKSKQVNEIAVLEESFNAMCEEIRKLIGEINVKNEQQKKAEINLLQSQINPHFIYNCLDTISWKAKEHEEYEIDDMIITLATFLRLGLHKGKNIMKVSDELEHVKCYLAMETERFPGLFDVEYRIDSKILEYNMVKIVLQPIVENAIKHGFNGINYKGLITINGYEDNESIVFEIKDNGVGMDWDNSSKIPESANPMGGYGLYNVNKRLSMYYNDEYSFEFMSKSGCGTTVRVKLGKNI